MQKRDINAQAETAKSSFSEVYPRLFDAREISGISSKSARIFLSGRVAKFINGAARSVSYTTTRTFGCMFMSFGLLSLLLHLLEYYFTEEPTVALSSLVISAVFALVAIPLVVFEYPMCHALQEFPLTDYIFFEFFAIKRMRKDTTVKTIKPSFGVIIGIIPAVLGFFFSIEAVVLVIFAVIFTTVALISPEFPFLFTLLVLPYLSLIAGSQTILVLLSLLTLVSFFRKVLLGKRVYHFEAYDIGIILLLLILVIGGVMGGGDSATLNAGIMISLLLGYIPAGNLVLNRRLADCTVNSVIVSSLPAALIAIAEYLTNLVNGQRAPASSTMSSPDALAAFLTVVSVLALFYAAEEKNKTPKILYCTALFVNLVALAATENIFLVLVILLSILAYAILRAPKIPNELIIGLAALPYTLFLLPFDTLERVFNFFGLSHRLIESIADFSEAMDIFADNLFLGIGARGFGAAESYPTFNMLLGVGCRFGIFALIIFALMILFRFRHLSAYAPYYRSSMVGGIVDMSAVAIFALFLMGTFYDIFEDMSVFYLFWCILGFCSASLRIAKKEHHDRIDYYRDQRSFDSADTSILLQRK